MNEKKFSTLRQQDLGIRKAMECRANKGPQMPPDLNERVMKRMETKPRRSFPIFAKWLSAAACLVASLLIGKALLDKGQTEKHQLAKAEVPSAIKTEPKQVAQPEIHKETKKGTQTVVKAEKQTVAKADAPMMKTIPSVAMASKPVEDITDVKKEEEVTTTEEVAVYQFAQQSNEHTEEEEAQPIYASIDEEADEDSTYQSPNKVDEFIVKLAANYGVRQELPDSIATGGSNISNAIYVFPDSKQADVMTRLMQIACWYGNTNPGYRLFMTQQQFLFELDNTREGKRHMWFAEKANKCTLLYCASAPIGEVISTACYLEFKEKTSREITNM